MPGGKGIFVGGEQLDFQPKRIVGELVDLDGELYYKIGNYNEMRPFLMSLTSDSDIWMFVSSNGGLTAGRKKADHAVFPYYTDDQITNLSEDTGSKSIFLVKKGDKQMLWLPFSDKYLGAYTITRNIYKNSFGNKLIFEEVNEDMGLCFRYRWLNSKNFGIIKKSELCNLGHEKKEVDILDGLVNLLPPGILQNVQQTKSNLANAYKKSELRSQSGIGLYSLSSNIIDRPEPSEALKATTIWHHGLGQVKHLLSTKQVSKFMTGQIVQEEIEMRAEPGAYIVLQSITLESQLSKSWYFVIDTLQSASKVYALEHLIQSGEELDKAIEDDVQKSASVLKNIISQVDGVQKSADHKGNIRHTANTMFNAMRGGFYADGYMVDKSDFIDFVSVRNKKVFDEHALILENLPTQIHIDQLKSIMEDGKSEELARFASEYLPITFSRRHGDPSRPWNKFDIDVLNDDGSWKKGYEGNWRDIFQNWEALCYSYPGFTENIITIFLNASTIDGYNPYRITSKGIEWEITDPEDPWSFIGYWGDHQIIYLLKLLELSAKVHPGRLEKYIDSPFYTFANVPYRIKKYQKIVHNPYDTIEYNEEEENQIAERVAQVGSDGKLVWSLGSIVRGSLTEKLLIPLLTKLSNFVPEGGIWMNTQRPEWNDANNALVGHGLSMVTVYYLNRYLDFLQQFYIKIDKEYFEIGAELDAFCSDILKAFSQNAQLLTDDISDSDRKKLTDLLGIAGEKYRQEVYDNYSGSRAILTKSDLIRLLELSRSFIEHTIRANRRPDKLYHAYNLIEFSSTGYGVRHLYQMLEGQVAVLSSGNIEPREALQILNSLRDSELYREDQQSYILYPDRQLSPFMTKAVIDQKLVNGSELLLQLIQKKDQSIIQQDVLGNYHFSPALSNANDLKRALADLYNHEDATLVNGEQHKVLEIYESVFNHHEFTGRSGTFFGYEGLGSIYWHMNSKLLLAVQEIYQKAEVQGADAKVIVGLKKHYFHIKSGLGTHKSPEVYGAFPTDPYSHTPANKGAQQPGMTGQVKEDIISRYGELGVKFINGSIEFQGSLLNSSEFIKQKNELTEFGLQGLMVENYLIFTLCTVPIIYQNSFKQRKIIVTYRDGMATEMEGLRLRTEDSEKIFGRSKSIKCIQVYLNIKD